MPPCKKCGQHIVWNHQDHEETGKWRPFDEETDEPHDCPENDWNSSSGEGSRRGGIDAVDAMSIDNSIIKLEDRMDELNKTMLKILSELKTVQMRIEGQMPLFPTNNNITATVVDKPINESEVVTFSESEEDFGAAGKRNDNVST